MHNVSAMIGETSRTEAKKGARSIRYGRAASSTNTEMHIYFAFLLSEEAMYIHSISSQKPTRIS